MISDARRAFPWKASFVPTGIAFGLRTVVATLGALWLAMWLQIDTPRWAAWTAMSLALPTRGLVAQKGSWRALGTLLGLVAGTVGIALFAQSPVAMGLYLSAWLAINVYAGGLLPGLASYGAALSGLTASLVIVLSAPAPLSIFNVAVARGADILLGVACVYVVSALAEVLQGPRPRTSVPSPASATRMQVVANTARAFAVAGVTWAIWMATAWPSGGYFVVFAGVVMIFFAMLPDADRRSLDYLWGAALGQALGLVTQYALLDTPTSFGLLACVLAPFILIGAVGLTDARTAGPAMGYNLSFLLAVNPANPMQYDLAASLNEVLAIFAGIAFGAAAYHVVLPDRLWRAAR